MMSVRLKIIKEVKRMADIISGNSRFGDGNNSKNKKVIHLVPEEQKQEENLDDHCCSHNCGRFCDKCIYRWNYI